jgi:hypothetical protein
MLQYVKSQVGGSTLTLPVADLAGLQPMDGILLVDVKGLGPPSAVIHTEGGPNTYGESVSYTKVEKRNIVITAVILETMESGDTDFGRTTLYNHFPVSKPITLAVKKSSRVGELIIDGIVESCEVNMFSQNENMDISIVCPFPYFRGSGGSVNIPPGHPTMIAYEGDADTGLTISITFSGVTGDIEILKQGGLYTMGIDMSIVADIVGGPSANGHTLTIDTRVGSKSIRYNTGGVVYNVMGALVPGSSWLTLYKGFNQFNYTLSSGSPIDMFVSYPELVAGV